MLFDSYTSARRFRCRIEAVKCGLRDRHSMPSCVCGLQGCDERTQRARPSAGHLARERRPGDRRSCSLPTAAATPSSSLSRSNPHNILEGNWQSCQEPPTGRYAERVYDHVVNGVPQFEVHLGPSARVRHLPGRSGRASRPRIRRQPPEAATACSMQGTRAKQRWEIPVAQARLHRHAGRRLPHRLRELVHPARAARKVLARTVRSFTGSRAPVTAGPSQLAPTKLRVRLFDQPRTQVRCRTG